MDHRNGHSHRSEQTYRVRIMAGIAAAELIALAFVLLWPVPDQGDPVYQDVIYSDSNTPIEEVRRTTQESKPPPPPAPPVPIEVPNDRIIEEDPIDFSDATFDEYADSLSTPMPESRGNSDEIAANPQLPPSVVRIVEPTLPSDLDGKLGEVVIKIRFLVNRDGSVEEASISEIRRINKDGSFEIVNDLPESILSATLRAAHQWRFRPARNEGSEVRAFVRHDFRVEI
ncbi:MAG: hypothetical protein U5K31_14570 [Balneolaceae bacterium]|nr:hypothetical protein [Balneolaceae bacterium]